MGWSNVIGRVPFLDCDPFFSAPSNEWSSLSTPPSWLSGHLLRKDCLIAPIPLSDYASNHEHLQLIPDIAIISEGKLGTSFIFGNRSIEKMRDIALPSDSSSSQFLLKWILSKRSVSPSFIDTGPHVNNMLNQCDGALVIGDRALHEYNLKSENIRLNLINEWNKLTGFPMILGVFASRKDSPKDKIRKAHLHLKNQINYFNKDSIFREQVIQQASERINISFEIIEDYFTNQLSFFLDNRGIKSLELFLRDVCELNSKPEWFNDN